jgi:hypothetical protein
MADQTKGPPPAFKYLFAPGQLLMDDFTSIHEYLPPVANEPPAAYAARCEAAGLGVVLTSQAAKEGGLKGAVASATAKGVPILCLSNAIQRTERQAPPPDPSEAKKVAYLAEARRVAAGLPPVIPAQGDSPGDGLSAIPK